MYNIAEKVNLKCSSTLLRSITVQITDVPLAEGVDHH